jgi:hypothetical protein
MASLLHLLGQREDGQAGCQVRGETHPHLHASSTPLPTIMAAALQATQRLLHFNSAWARRLEVSAVLKGHAGCVNRLAWSEDGSVLASGSDDRKVRAPRSAHWLAARVNVQLAPHLPAELASSSSAAAHLWPQHPPPCRRCCRRPHTPTPLATRRR